MIHRSTTLPSFLDKQALPGNVRYRCSCHLKSSANLNAMFLNNSCLTQRSSSEQCLATSTPPNVGPSQILPFLYLGSQEDALSSKAMQDHHITHVINVSTTGEKAPFLDETDDEHFLRIAVNDCHSAQLSPFFDQAYHFIEKARQNNGRVFIHCLAGISRSPALAVSYIMRHSHLTADDAYRYIKARRPYISPNFNFLGQLNEYERQLSSTIKFNTCSPIGKCLINEPPLTDRRRLLHLEGTSTSLKREHNNDQPKGLSRPQGFNFDLINTRRPQSLLSPSSGLAKLTVESPQPPQRSSLPPKLLRPNSITLKRSSPTDEANQPNELLNSSSASETTNKRVKTLPRSTDSSPLAEKSDLINTFFEGAASATQSNESTGEASNLAENRANSLSSSRELLVT